MKQWLALVLILFLVACDSSPGEKLVDYNFKQGIAEVQMRLLENAPPDLIYENSEFKFIVELDNQAAYDATEGIVYLDGILDDYFQILPDDRSFADGDDDGILVGRSLTSPSGEKIFLDFDGRSGLLFANSWSQVNPFFLRANYRSSMEFSDTICINPNLYAIYDSGCEVELQKSYNGQGAPIAVTDMEEIIIPGAASQVEFRVYLANRGNGYLKTLDLQSARLGGTNMLCSFQGEGAEMTSYKFEEFEQEALLICKQLLGKQSSYTTTLVLDFDYEYELIQQHVLELAR